MSRTWLSAARDIDGVDIVGLADLDLTRARERAASAGLVDVAIEAGVEALLERTRPDVLFDVAVPQVRPQIVRAALAHGCHVLTEKPMAPTIEAAREMVSMARDAGRIHAVIQNRRYHPGVRRLRRFLAGGAIGETVGLYCDFFKAPHFGGFREEMRHVLLLDMAIHTFDAARLLAGATPDAVYCRENNPAGSWYAHGASADALCELPRGAPRTSRWAGGAEGLQTSWEASWRIVGTRGTVTWDGEGLFRAERATAAPRDGLFSMVETVEVGPLDPDDAIGGHAGVLRDVIRAVREGGEPETVGHENIRSLAMVLSAIDSAERRERVSIELGVDA